MELALARGRLVSLLVLLSACVVAVTVSTEIDEPVQRIDIQLDRGDVTVTAAPGNVLLTADFGGVGDGSLDYDVVDGVLTIDGDCGGDLCGGTLDLTAPPRVDVAARLRTGTVLLDGMAGSPTLTVGTGAIEGTDLSATRFVAAVDLGDVDIAFSDRPESVSVTAGAGAVRIEVPSGQYALDISAGSASVRTEGITADDDAIAQITVRMDSGSVTVLGR